MSGQNRGLQTAGDAEVQMALLQELERARAADPFQLLGCEYDADDAAIRAAYLRSTKNWHPNRFARRPAIVRELATEVFVHIRGAWDLIARDPERHKQLKLLGKLPRLDPTPVPVLKVAGSAARKPAAKKSAAKKHAAKKPADKPAAKKPPPAAKPAPSVPAESESQAFERGRALLRHQRFAAAYGVFDELARQNPKDKRFRVHKHYANGRDHQLENRIDEARAEYNRALDLDPDFARAKTALESLGAKTKSRGLFSKLFRK